MGYTNQKIGELEDGSPDPCYTCKHIDEELCQTCNDYDKAESK